MIRMSINYGERLGQNEAICLTNDIHDLTKRGVYHVEEIKQDKVLILNDCDTYQWYNINDFC